MSIEHFDKFLLQLFADKFNSRDYFAPSRSDYNLHVLVIDKMTEKEFQRFDEMHMAYSVSLSDYCYSEGFKDGMRFMVDILSNQKNL